ncbi:MAG: flagellar export protein FliJ [Lachnospiraceae bacterium]|nr:flagellar export protein FliJ [Lachnospiraceae bacterium]
MARFRYSLQNVLDIKMKMETQAKQVFSAAKAALDEEEERLQSLYEKKRLYEEKAKELLNGRLDMQAIEENKQSVLFAEQMITEQKRQVLMAERRLEEARRALAEVMMERKTHETLREKAFEEFLLEENRAESKSVDELVSYTYGQKKEK